MIYYKPRRSSTIQQAGPGALGNDLDLVPVLGEEGAGPLLTNLRGPSR